MAPELDEAAKAAMSVDSELRDFMLGENTSFGGRFDGDPRGLTSDVKMPREEPPPRPTEPDVRPQPEANDWKQLYGQEANEKGTWRRTAEEAIVALNQAKAEIEAMRASSTPSPSAPGGGYYMPPPVQYPQQQQAQQPQPPERFLPGKAEDDLVQVGEVERLVQERIAPAVMQLAYGQQRLMEGQLAAFKGSLGVTPAVEAAATKENPWIGAIADPFAKAQAIASLAKREPAKPNPAQVENAAARATFIESTRPSTSGHEVSQAEVVQQELREAMTKPFGAPRSRALEAVMKKYGVSNANDFGPDFWTR